MNSEWGRHHYSPKLTPKCWGVLSISLFWTSKICSFFCIPLYPDFQYIFLPLNGGALTPRRLPSIPGQCSHWVLGTAPSYLELWEWSLEKGTLLQYVDDLLISSEAKKDSNKSTISFLAERGYKFSPTKAQISQQWIQYLGFVLTSGAWAMTTDGNIAISATISNHKEANPSFSWVGWALSYLDSKLWPYKQSPCAFMLSCSVAFDSLWPYRL